MSQVTGGFIKRQASTQKIVMAKNQINAFFTILKNLERVDEDDLTADLRFFRAIS